ncbi:MAG TPA: MFS transporter [Rhizomicrobium sp.]|nr:MFS transporter [Rhizomicrobium sp.]
MSDSSLYRARDFQVFLSARFLSTTAMMVQSVAVGWQVYAISHSALALGFVGLSEFVPMFLLTLPAGEVSDRFDQRFVLALALALEAVCGLLLILLTLGHTHSVLPYYAVMAVFGFARAFSGPAAQSLLPFVVAPKDLPKSIAWSSSVFQVAVIAGPAIGGYAYYVLGPVMAYALCAVCFFGAGAAVSILGGRRKEEITGETSAFERVAEGVRFVRSRPVVLGAISLDLFAVLLGGATALLPIYARDILFVGPAGLGMLRSAPAVGAALVAILLGRRPLVRHAGRRMFGAVAVFGAATIAFGVSTNFYLSLVALAILGASDMISVFIRHALVQFATPDGMRGRVSAVNMLFIGASNELGEFESGLTAALFGTVPAVIIGGIGTLIVVGVWMALFPPLRTVDRLAEVSA